MCDPKKSLAHTDVAGIAGGRKIDAAEGPGPERRRLAMAPAGAAALQTTRAQKGHFCSSAD